MSDDAAVVVRLAALANLGLLIPGGSFFISPMRTDLLGSLEREYGTLEVTQGFSLPSGWLFDQHPCDEIEMASDLRRLIKFSIDCSLLIDERSFRSPPRYWKNPTKRKSRLLQNMYMNGTI
ncbi:hypothetical protein GJ744_003201 [Endocarpon pusillum]|uniref:Uncharacterized protein n=1 Tax=Endocarpon pusillum TaxID=364733 RepID=A0A8H7AMT7_9EURO|nr:hypothetical protein GJ744_003201 [Endocarpon pusillum]